jgi:hypothetical protein
MNVVGLLLLVALPAAIMASQQSMYVQVEIGGIKYLRHRDTGQLINLPTPPTVNGRPFVRGQTPMHQHPMGGFDPDGFDDVPSTYTYRANPNNSKQQ